jgi:hypothetical protein
MTAPSENLRFQRTEAFVARAIGGETVLVPIRRQIGDLESIYTLNDVATVIWERLAQPSTVAEIALVLDEAFAGDPAEMRSDLDAFLAELLDLGAVRSTDPHGPAASA